jgi:dGTPase
LIKLVKDSIDTSKYKTLEVTASTEFNKWSAVKVLCWKRRRILGKVSFCLMDKSKYTQMDDIIKISVNNIYQSRGHRKEIVGYKIIQTFWISL